MRLIENAPHFEGAVAFEVRRNGKVIDSFEDHNLIVTSGRQRMAELLTGLSTSHIGFVGVGTGQAPANVTDTHLTDQVLVPITGVTAENRVARFNFLIGTNDANGLQISEFGLFGQDGTMFSHRVRDDVIGKADDIEIEGYWEIRF